MLQLDLHLIVQCAISNQLRHFNFWCFGEKTQSLLIFPAPDTNVVKASSLDSTTYGCEVQISYPQGSFQTDPSAIESLHICRGFEGKF